MNIVESLVKETLNDWDFEAEADLYGNIDTIIDFEVETPSLHNAYVSMKLVGTFETNGHCVGDPEREKRLEVACTNTYFELFDVEGASVAYYPSGYFKTIKIVKES